MNIYDKIDFLKAKIDSLRPFEGSLLSDIKAYYRIGLTWSSNALEGNTLNESETKILLEDGLTVAGKPLKDTFEAIGHSKAYDFMFTLLNNKTITEEDILTMHKMFYSQIDAKNAGKYRDREVIISGSKFPVAKPSEIQKEISDFLNWLSEAGGKFHPVELSAVAHKKFVFIHPFVDGNGRVARLLMNAILIQRGYLIAIIPPILRQDYISLLEKAHNNDAKFLEFIAERVYESEKELAKLLHVEV